MTRRGIGLIVLGTALCFGALAMTATAQVPGAAEAGGLIDRLTAWARDGYRHAPALMLGLAVVAAIPVLALLGLLLRRKRRAAPASRSPRGTRDLPEAASEPATGRPGDGMTWPVDAWLELSGPDGVRMPVGREMLRIGRDDDNDLVLADDSVHRNHAVVHRTEDAEIVLIDLSGEGGNGVVLNGKRTSRARLRNGDTIGIGDRQLKFVTRRA